MQKNADAFRTISEVADDLSLPQHVLRFWETRFPQVRPLKRAGGRRYYRPTDITLLRRIRELLYDDGYTIKGVQKLLKEQGVRGLSTGSALPADVQTPDDAALCAEDTLFTAPQESAADSLATDGATVLTQVDRAQLEQALAAIEDCRRILDTLRERPVAAPI